MQNYKFQPQHWEEKAGFDADIHFIKVIVFLDIYFSFIYLSLI